jgi:hypothetical protein
MRYLALVCFIVFTSCGGKSPTRPSAEMLDTSQGNLAQAPPDAHTVRIPVGEDNLTVKFWYEYSPLEGSSPETGQPYSITLQCRRSAMADYGLVLKATPVASNGSSDEIATSIFGTGDTVRVAACDAASPNTRSGAIPSDFAGLKDASVEAWLQYWPPGTSTSPAPVIGAAQAAVTEVIGWTEN